MAQKPSIPKGTRDFSPTEVAKRNYIFSTIKQVFEVYGFQPIETPSFENSSTLMGKYGEEGDRLIFKILNSGDYLKDVEVILKKENYLQKILNQDFFQDFFNKFISKISFLNTLSDIEGKLSEKDKNILADCLISYLIEKKYIVDKLGIPSEEKTFILDSLKLNYNEILSTCYKILEVFKYGYNNPTLYLSTVNNLRLNILGKYFSKYLTPIISEKALRYDLTVPFARYVVQHRNDIVFPFKRYQMQPVWRADKPQKGRFREFYQCDADVVGSKGLWQEVEFVQLYDAVFSKLKLVGTTIKLNNRKILAGIAEIIGAKDKLIDFTVALDKLDKIGKEGVTKEMLAKGISAAAIEKVQPLFGFNGTNQEKLNQLQEMLAESPEGLKGIEDVRFVINNIEELGLQSANLELDVTLARGLNYYTGAIYEVSAPETVKIGAIGGGGRYDDLTGIFGLKDVSGVGISFGLDRIYLVLEELNLFDKVELPKPKVLFLNLGDKEASYCLKALASLRKNNIKSELYPDNTKMKKQMMYANRRTIPYVVIVGTNELEKENYTLKNMQTGEQQVCNLEELLKITASL